LFLMQGLQGKGTAPRRSSERGEKKITVHHGGKTHHNIKGNDVPNSTMTEEEIKKRELVTFHQSHIAPNPKGGE